MVDDAPIIEREDVRVMFRRTADEQESITRTWADVERTIGSLRGRKFYGVFDQMANEYRVCVQWQEGDNAEALGLEDGTLPGGRYLRVRLEGEPPQVYALIPPSLERLRTAPNARGCLQ